MARTLLESMYLDEGQIARQCGLDPDAWAAAARVLENSGMPRRDPLFGNRRCWPAVRDFLLDRARGKLAERGYSAPAEHSEENLDAFRSQGSRRRAGA